MLVAAVAVSALFMLVACDNSLADKENSYVITGQFNGWKVNTLEDDEKKLNDDYTMTAIALDDKRVESIKDQLKDVKYLYIIEHTFTNNKGDQWVNNELNDNGDPINPAGWEAGWSVKYKLTADATDFTEVDGNMAIKVIRTKYEEVEGLGAWKQDWMPDAGNTTFKSLTPATLYMPPHSQAETYPGSGSWNDNPIALKAGAAYVVFAEFNDGTYGLGLIAK